MNKKWENSADLPDEDRLTVRVSENFGDEFED